MTYGVVRLNERVVAGNDVNVRVLDAGGVSVIGPLCHALPVLGYSRIAEDNAANTAKSVDTDL